MLRVEHRGICFAHSSFVFVSPILASNIRASALASHMLTRAISVVPSGIKNKYHFFWICFKIR